MRRVAARGFNFCHRCFSHYKVLGIENNASTAEIKKAYREKAKTLHPDTNPDGDEKSLEAFRKLQGAYEVLKDAPSRQVRESGLGFRKRQSVWPGSQAA